MSSRNLFLGGFIISLIILVTLTQAIYDEHSKPFSFKLESIDRHILPAKLLEYTNFGFKNMLADYYWIMAVQDLSYWNNKDVFYLEYFKNISVLDPKFEYPYLFSIYVVPNEKAPKLLDNIASIAETGMSALHNNWAIPFYLGTKYKTLVRDNEKAELYLKRASEVKTAPPVVNLVYTSFLKNQAQDRKDVTQMIKVIYDTTDNGTIKKLAAKGILINDLSDVIEKAIARFKIKYKVFPKNSTDLERTNLLTLPREIKDAFDVEISGDGGFRLVEKENTN